MTQSDLNILEAGTIIVRPGQLERVSKNCSCAGVFKSRNPIFAEIYDFMRFYYVLSLSYIIKEH